MPFHKSTETGDRHETSSIQEQLPSLRMWLAVVEYIPWCLWRVGTPTVCWSPGQECWYLWGCRYSGSGRRWSPEDAGYLSTSMFCVLQVLLMHSWSIVLLYLWEKIFLCFWTHCLELTTTIPQKITVFYNFSNETLDSSFSHSSVLKCKC